MQTWARSCPCVCCHACMRTKAQTCPLHICTHGCNHAHAYIHTWVQSCSHVYAKIGAIMPTQYVIHTEIHTYTHRFGYVANLARDAWKDLFTRGGSWSEGHSAAGLHRQESEPPKSIRSFEALHTSASIFAHQQLRMSLRILACNLSLACMFMLVHLCWSLYVFKVQAHVPPCERKCAMQNLQHIDKIGTCFEVLHVSTCGS
jgi:hypothetical protein